MENKQEAIESFAGGMSPKDIADELEVSISTVYRWLSDSGLVNRINEGKNAAIIETYSNTDVSIHDILLQFGISQSALYKLLHRQNIPLRSSVTRAGMASDKEIIQMYEEHLPLSEIQLKSNRSLSYIYSILRKYKVPLRRPLSFL